MKKYFMKEKLPQRKRPVHMPPSERHNMPVIFFVTMCLQPRMPVLTSNRFMDAFICGCKDADSWSVGRYMIMPDHLHLFCQPTTMPATGVKHWSSYLKRKITMCYGQHEWNWQNDIWDAQIRNGDQYHEKWEYVRLNPVRKGLVVNADDWPWTGELNILWW